jgi:DNA-binding transcriptional LysR family regulator
MSTLTNYRVFVAIAETGSIVQAALQLNYSAPAISKQLTKLEKNLKIQLFNRSHKKLEITEAGKRFYPHCKNILLSISQAEEELLTESNDINGTIAITLSKSLARSKIFDALSEFNTKHPQITFNISFSDHFEDLYNENIDFAFRLGKLPDNNHMIAMPLVETKLMACATPRYLEQHGTPKDISDLSKAKLIVMSPLYTSEALRNFFKTENIHPDTINSHIVNDIEGVYQSIRTNLGIGMLLDISIEQEIKEKKFIPVLPQKDLPRKHLYLIYKKKQWQTQKQLAFKKHIKLSFEKD